MKYNPVDAKTGYGITCEPLFTSLSSVQIPLIDFLLRPLAFIGLMGVQTSEGSRSFPSWLEDRTSGRFRVALVFKSPMARLLESC
jgi:hypothetical protein